VTAGTPFLRSRTDPARRDLPVQPVERSQDPDTPGLSCRNLWKVYGAGAEAALRAGFASGRGPEEIRARLREKGFVPAVCGVSFEVRRGEIFVIMGLSGSGKSTVVRCLSRLVEPSAGEVSIDGHNILASSEAELIEIRRHRMGMVFQNFGLMPHMDVLDNVAYPLRVQGVRRAERTARALETIRLVGLEGRESSYPRELSGGMQQRVGIARSLAVKPDFWFLDEPFSALDPLIRRQMQDEFLRLQRLLNKTIVFITHDFLEALRIADRVAIMRDGCIIQIGTAGDLVRNPVDGYVADFTRDVPRNRIITAANIMRPESSVTESSRGIAASTTLDAVLGRLVQVSPLAVLGEGGQILGEITLDLAIAALVEDPAAGGRGDDEAR
jgi:glycine betaine/proline transport system ATP-binding protein